MFQQGEYVIYNDSGLCLVEQIGVPDFVTDRSKTYYFLRVQEDGSRVYVPVDTRLPLRAPITAEAARQLLSALPDLPLCPPPARDHKTVQLHYQQLIRPHTCEALAQTVKTIRSRHRGAPGRMNSAEEAVLKRAEKLLGIELAAALAIPESEAIGQVEERLRATNDE